MQVTMGGGKFSSGRCPLYALPACQTVVRVSRNIYVVGHRQYVVHQLLVPVKGSFQVIPYACLLCNSLKQPDVSIQLVLVCIWGVGTTCSPVSFECISLAHVPVAWKNQLRSLCRRGIDISPAWMELQILIHCAPMDSFVVALPCFRIGEQGLRARVSVASVLVYAHLIVGSFYSRSCHCYVFLLAVQRY